MMDEQKEDSDSKFSFKPPLFQQRYTKVADIIRNSDVKKVVDFGCAECMFVKKLKRMQHLEQVIGVDIDRSVLETNAQRMSPQTSDYIFKRKNPMNVVLYEGDIVKFDSRLRHVDAVTMIELIEHLEADVLEQLPKALFENLQPDIVVMTTPNSEFNVVFPDFEGFRHTDHKFEWTREEFQSWCTRVCDQYSDYSVTFDGIGHPPSTHPDVGHCSQMALFTRKATNQDRDTDVAQEHNYSKVCDYEYEYMKEEPLEERIYNEASCIINNISSYDYQKRLHDDDVDNPGDIEITMERLMEREKLTALCTDEATIRDILMKKGTHVFSSDGSKILVTMQMYERDDLDDYHDYDDDNIDSPLNQLPTQNGAVHSNGTDDTGEPPVSDEEECWD